MEWYESAIIHYDWVRYGENLSRDYARFVVRKALDLHADTLAFCAQVGGYALWDSKVTEKAEMIADMDLIGELAALCRENNLRFVPWWLGTALGVEAILRKHPDWQIVGPPREDGTQKQHNYICYNTPYRELLYAEIREVLEAYRPDGIYFDQLPGSCYCSTCRAKFEQRYGQPMPIVPDEFFVYNTAAGLPPMLREYRDQCVREFCAGVRKIIDEVSPKTCYAQNWVRNQQAYLAVGNVDVLLPEFYQSEDLLPLGMKHRLTKTYFDHGAIWGNVRHSVRHDGRHHPLRGTRMLLVECLANRASPLLLDLCCMDFDRTGTDQLAETFDHIRAMQETLAGSEPVRYAALLHSRRSHELYPGRFDEGFEGMYRMLLEAHIPFEIVNETGIRRGELGDYRVLVVPDAVSLADASLDAIRSAVADGMGLIGTYMTAVVDENGSPRDRPGLADLFGFEIKECVDYDALRSKRDDPILKLPNMGSERPVLYASAEPGHPLAKCVSPEARFGFEGAFLIIDPSGDAETIGYVHEIDQPRYQGRIHNRPGYYPGRPRCPLGVTRQVGKGRVGYFATQTDATWRRLDAPQLETIMLNSVLWAGGGCPLESPQIPRSVEVRLFHNPERKIYQILLVNLTVNPLVRPPGGWGVVRYVTPHKDLTLVLRTSAKVRAVGSLLGADVRYEAKAQNVTIRLPLLDLYESLTVEYC